MVTPGKVQLAGSQVLQYTKLLLPPALSSRPYTPGGYKKEAAYLLPIR
jgi:hypothetical protein